MPRYFLRLSYKGTAYAGWQIQDNAVTVQEKLNIALTVIAAQTITTTGCGRTDTGVHAKVFYAHFDIENAIADSDKFLHQLNAVLPSDISVFEIIPVAAEAHARYDATMRTYEYFISLDKNPFLKEFSMHGFKNPDPHLMNQACPLLLEHSDFTAFSKSNTQVKTAICKITRAEWKQYDKLLVFTISSDRFLRGMVRAIVGTMMDIGTGKIAPQELSHIIKSENRSEAGVSVPAGGLFLSGITYPYLPFYKPASFPA